MLFQPRSPFLMTIMATRAGFLVAGLGLSVWAPLVPYVRQRIPMDDATFGLLLLSIGLGSLCCMPLTALLTERFGIRHTLLGAATLLITALCGMIVSSQFGVLALALFCFGGSMGVLDIVLNVQGLAVESRANRNLMSGFHGMFSLGTIMGALLVSLLLMAGLSPVVSPLLAVACMAVLCLWAQPGFIDRRTRRDPDGLRWPSGFIILIGLMCFIVYLAEGAILDWSALFLIDFRAMPPASAGLGYAAFALMITIGRFSGDNLSKKLGRVAVIGGGGVLAAAGIGLSLASQHWALALLGYGLCGLGCANVSPLLMSLLNQQKRVPPHLAVTAATTIGFAGVLAGPAMMGFVAQYSSLAHAFAMVAGGLLLVALASLGIRK